MVQVHWRRFRDRVRGMLLAVLLSLQSWVIRHWLIFF